MLLIREIMYCKPGKVRPMVKSFLAMSQLMEKAGLPPMKVMTDLSAERYWTIVSEMEVPSLEEYFKMDERMGDMPELGEMMKDYHDLIDWGRREIYTVEEAKA
jgi:hypothetical protein